MASHRKYPQSETDRDTAVDDAERMVGEMNYKLLFHNCEHFVTEILTGKAWSTQTAKLMAFLSGVALVGGLIVTVIGALAHQSNNNATQHTDRDREHDDDDD